MNLEEIIDLKPTRLHPMLVILWAVESSMMRHTQKTEVEMDRVGLSLMVMPDYQFKQC